LQLTTTTKGLLCSKQHSWLWHTAAQREWQQPATTNQHRMQQVFNTRTYMAMSHTDTTDNPVIALPPLLAVPDASIEHVYGHYYAYKINIDMRTLQASTPISMVRR
jgi:hypothetical protein